MASCTPASPSRWRIACCCGMACWPWASCRCASWYCRVERGQHALDEVQVHHEARPRMGPCTAHQHARQYQQQRHQLDGQDHPHARAVQVGEPQVVHRQQRHQAEKRHQAQHPGSAHTWLQPLQRRQHLGLLSHGRSPAVWQCSPGAGPGHGTGRSRRRPGRACHRPRHGGWRHTACRRPGCRATPIRCRAAP